MEACKAHASRDFKICLFLSFSSFIRLKYSKTWLTLKISTNQIHNKFTQTAQTDVYRMRPSRQVEGGP